MYTQTRGDNYRQRNYKNTPKNKTQFYVAKVRYLATHSIYVIRVKSYSKKLHKKT